MKYSRFFLPTLREDPAEAEVISHKLMVRAGLIRKLASGIYSYLPLGLRVLNKVEQIIREEMNKAGAQELLMPRTSTRGSVEGIRPLGALRQGAAQVQGSSRPRLLPRAHP